MNADTLAEAIRIAEALDAQVDIGGGDLDELAQGATLLRTLAAEVERLGAAVPAGMVLVPAEPTQEMCQQGQWKAQEWPQFPLRIVPIWKAMLAAVPLPTPPSAQEPQGSGVGGE